LPGQLFSKTDIMRSAREVAQLGHFDPEKFHLIQSQIRQKELLIWNMTWKKS